MDGRGWSGCRRPRICGPPDRTRIRDYSRSGPGCFDVAWMVPGWLASYGLTMALNDPYQPGSVRQPRMQILHDGQSIGGALAFSIEQNNYYASDTFRCQFAYNVDPEH